MRKFRTAAILFGVSLAVAMVAFPTQNASAMNGGPWAFSSPGVSQRSGTFWICDRLKTKARGTDQISKFGEMCNGGRATNPSNPSNSGGSQRLTSLSSAQPVKVTNNLSPNLASGSEKTTSSGCADVDLSFARGTGEMAGLGSLGTLFASAVKTAAPNKKVNVYAVDYAASVDQSSAGPGGQTLADHVNSIAAKCPDTRFILGGYSQGASVVDYAVGATMGFGGANLRSINPNASKQVVAVVTFGNPLELSGRTIVQAVPAYAARTQEFCASGDPVCGNGSNFAAHLSYRTNGDVQKAAIFAAQKVK